MVISRGLALARLTSIGARRMLLLNRGINGNKKIVRLSHSDFLYRQSPGPYPKKDYIAVEVIGAIIWWWVLWHIVSDYHDLVGHTFPDPSKWTDEELGIPPDDE